jgi:DNA repair protein RadD
MCNYIEVIPAQAPSFGEIGTASPPNLRQYQHEAVAAIRQAFKRYRRVLFVLPTGGGKTIVFSYVAMQATAKGNRVLILAHRQEILDQISTALTDMGVIHGLIRPGHAVTAHPVQIGMVQTVARRLGKLAEPKFLIIDEAHHAVAGTWTRIAGAWPKAKVLGVSATPERLDGVGLGEAFDELVIGPDIRALIDAGYIAPFRYLAPSTAIDLSSVRSVGGDYSAADLENALDNECITGDVVEHYQKHLLGRTAIVFCVTTAHAEHVAARFRDNGIPAASIDGAMSADQRRDLVNKLRDGGIRVLASCEVISEGFDAPAVGGAILLRPTKSFALFRQQVGRCLRPKPDGSAAVIVDHVDNVSRHGLPDAVHEWSLHSKKRTQGDRRQQAAAGCRKCQACDEVFPTGAGLDMCPMPEMEGCLFQPSLPVERCGELEDVGSAPWAHGLDIRNARGWQWFQLLQHADGDPARLRQIQVARGYKPAWVRYAAAEAAAKRGGGLRA